MTAMDSGYWSLLPFISALFAPLVFLGNFYLALLGVMLWAVGMGAHGSLMRAVVGKMVSPNKRASAYGIFNMGYGIAWFAGSAVMGLLYDISLFMDNFIYRHLTISFTAFSDYRRPPLGR